VAFRDSLLESDSNLKHNERAVGLAA
jgi:hypothetical protein